MLIRPYDPGNDAADVDHLLAACRAAGDADPLSEGKRIALRHGSGRAIVAISEGAMVGFGQLVAYAGHEHEPPDRPHHHPESRWEGEFVVHPDRRLECSESIGRAVVAGAPPDALVEMWGAETYQREALEGMGWRPFRSLHRLEIAPVPVDVPRLPEGVRVDAFAVGRDEDEFLAANHAAFTDHPEQSSWDRAALESRFASAWFDARGFLLARRSGELVGFCWTKVHRDEDDLGEIFLIGVVPAAQGIGLGHGLTSAGLAHLSGDRGVARAMLYVDGANDPALAMYRRMGFRRVATKRVFRSAPAD